MDRSDAGWSDGAGWDGAGRDGAAGWDAGELSAALARWAADSDAAERAGQRARERWLRQQASEEATLTGLLVDLAEAGVPVAVATAWGVVRGRVSAVGRDFLVLSASPQVAVALSAVVSVTPGPGYRRDPTGARNAPVDLDLGGLLGIMAADRAPVQLTLAGGGVLRGTLTTAGADMVELAAGRGRDRVAVPTAAIQAVAPARS